jgi:hypothetical protein
VLCAICCTSLLTVHVSHVDGLEAGDWKQPPQEGQVEYGLQAAVPVSDLGSCTNGPQQLESGLSSHKAAHHSKQASDLQERALS